MRTVATVLALTLLAPIPARALEAVPPARPAPAPGVRLFLVRHAEPLVDGTTDPSLSPQGRERAGCLARTLGHERITRVLTSPWKRASETADRVAAPHALKPEPRDPMKLEALAAELRALEDGTTAFVVGHSNTLPALVKALGGEMTGLVVEAGQPTIPREEHDRLVVLTLRRGAGDSRSVEVEERRFHCDAKE